MQPAISSLPGWEARADADAVAAEPGQLSPLLDPIVATGSAGGAPGSPTATSLFSVRVTGKSSALSTAAGAGDGQQVEAAAAPIERDLINLDSAPIA
jgi:hypothetical protein